MCFQDRYFQMQLFWILVGCLFVCLFALVKADFTTGLIAYIWIYAMLNTVCFGDLSEASA